MPALFQPDFTVRPLARPLGRQDHPNVFLRQLLLAKSLPLEDAGAACCKHTQTADYWSAREGFSSASTAAGRADSGLRLTRALVRAYPDL